MKNHLQKKIKQVAKIYLVLLVGLISFTAYDLNAQCDPVITGEAFTCASNVETYVATRGVPGSALNWALSGGGTILALNNNNTEATIQWDAVSGGPYRITVTETDVTPCSATFEFDVVIESEFINLACNDLVHVALDQNCQAEITADMILEDPLYDEDSYIVHLSDSDNNPIAGNVVDIQYLNEIVNVTIEHVCSGISCWGEISVQDNIAPGLECNPGIIEIECDDSYAPEAVGFPLPSGSTIVNIANNEYSVEVPGECGGAYSLVYSDEIDNLNCGAGYDFIVNRTWVATDSAGNSTSCEEQIGAVWGSLTNMTLPPHYDGIVQFINHLPTMQCSDANAPFYWPFDYNPGPEVTGYPEWSGCSNIQYYYEDVAFNLCGNSRKIVRHWLILDWCSGQDFIYDQLLIIDDTKAPVVSKERDTLHYSTDPGICLGTAYPIPAPKVIFDCSGWSYTIGYQFKDEFGNLDPVINTENVFEGPEGFGITGLPADTTWVTYFITDECNNKTIAHVELVVEDTEAPTAVCEKHTVVTLTSDGTASIYATSVDDGSNDNCGLDRFEIRRMDTNCGIQEDLVFGESVDFCCKDVGETVILIFRVYDLNGLFSDCMVEVTVQDKMPPVIVECPGTVYLNCGQDYTNLNLTGGMPVVEDNCDNFEIIQEDKVYLGDCGTGYIKRIWKVVDGSDVNVSCNQFIYIEDNEILTYDDIAWPKDIELPGCNSLDAKPELTGSPELTVNSCKDIGIGYSDQVINNAQGSCLEILREWKVGDWCETPPYTYITHTQVITVQETELPYFVSCKDIVVESDNDNCDASVTVKADATDDCTPKEDLKYTWEIDFDKDGSIDDTGLSNAFTRVFPHGRHWVYYTVYDICGNANTCKTEVRVKDVKDPTPVCLAKVTTTIMSTGMLPVQASSFNVCQCSSGSFDNCTPKEDLRYSFSSDVSYTERIFTCDDITNGVAETFELEMWVTDLDGNQDFCNVELVIMDNVHACEDAANASASLSGFIVNQNLNGMPEFEVELAKDEIEIYQETTNEEGLYVFEDLDVYSKYKLQPKKDNDPSNGVSTLDLVLIQKHILGLIPLDTPYKLIAADANNTGSISAADLLEIRSLILGTTDDFDKNDSWRFINDEFEFENPAAPWEFEDNFIIDELYLDSDSINFIGIKVGDVNNSAQQYFNGTELEPRSMDNFELVCSDQEIITGNTVNIPVFVDKDQWVSGFQFTLDFDAQNVEILEVLSALINLQPHNLNYNNASEGKISISWNLADALFVPAGTELFSLKVKGQHKGWISEFLMISSAITKAEAYDDHLKLMEIDLRFENDYLHQMQVYQNQPNPFAEDTAIRFYLPSDADIDLTVYDTSGKIIKKELGHYSKGMNSITLQKDLFTYQGIYFFKITKDETSVVKKMIFSR